MQILSVCGGKPLEGCVPVSGAKNSVLPILAACTLCRGTCVLHNCPNISDVDDTLEILQSLGCRTARSGAALTVDAGGMGDVRGSLALPFAELSLEGMGAVTGEFRGRPIG